MTTPPRATPPRATPPRATPTWDDYFIALARHAATRSTCDRRAVGCVLVAPDRTVLSTGYNGSAPGAPHCSDVGHLHLPGSASCHRTIHAEQNAVARVARRGGAALDGSTAYVTTRPCMSCLRLLCAAGVRHIVWADDYGDDGEAVAAWAAGAGVAWEQHPKEK